MDLHSLPDNMFSSVSDIDARKTLIIAGSAALYCYVIALFYRLTYKGPNYDIHFSQSIVMLGVLVSLVIALIGGNTARAFGVFGALSIIRYRVPLKDPIDLTYILASVVIGLACGVGEVVEAGFATCFLLGLILILSNVPTGLGNPDQPPVPLPEPPVRRRRKKKSSSTDSATSTKKKSANKEPKTDDSATENEASDNGSDKKEKADKEAEPTS